MANEAIVVSNVSVKFNLAKEKVDNAKEYALKLLKKQIKFDEFYALRNVSFSIEKGDSFAILGENGCGKSTLLKVISGIYYPTVGSVKTEGSISPLIELGAGFDMDLTARENIYLNGAVLGYSKEFMQEHFDEIIDFSELHEFVDVPLKNYSSGMVARLGFAIATVTTPDILIVDEILAVGDMNFQQKCQKKMSEMLSGGTTLLFVSHDINQVKNLCKHAIWLNHGIVQMVGDAQTVADAYVKDMTENGGNGIVHLEDIQKPEEKEQKEAQSTITATAPKNKHPFAVLRASIASLMVLYHQVFEVLFTNLGIGNKLISFIHNHVTVPFHIDLGYIGIFILFLVAGYLSHDALSSSSSGAYLFGSVKRIFPTLFIATAFLWFFQWIIGMLSEQATYWSQFTVWEWIQSATLIGHFTGVSERVIGITWFLVTLVIYYVASTVLKPLIKDFPTAYLLSMTAFVAVFTFGLANFGGLWYTFAAYIRYIPAIILGQIFFMANEENANRRNLAILFALNFILLIQNMRLFAPEDYYGAAVKAPSLVVGLILFAAAFLIRERLKDLPFGKGIGIFAYALVLSNLSTAQLIVPLLISTSMLSSTMVALIYLAAVFVIAALEYLVINILSKAIHAVKRRLSNE